MSSEVTKEEVAELRGEVGDLKIRVAVAESNISEVKSKLNKIDTNISKLLWLVGAAILAIIINILFKGGIIL